jgi:osmoprotectant transport system ATP-binding protein
VSEAEATSESQPRSGASSVSYEGASKRYGNSGALAVDQLTLEVPAGEICVLVGPSGCGKTTAMRMVNRTVEMTAGDILVGGESVRDREPARLRREIGYVIQQIGLFPHRTIAENIAAVPQLLGWKKERTRQRTAELLELIGLDPELGERYPAQLSGGQQQRVGVARALAADPLVMLMDEPFGAIDPISRERLQNEFLRLQAQVRKTVLFVTHDIDEAIKMGDRIAIMKEGGKVEQYATPAEILMAPATEFVEDFVGADRALKRLALMRVADIDLWKAPLAHVGQATAEVRAKLAEPDVEVPYPLLVDSERRPLGWLSERDLRAETVPSRPDSPLGPLLDRDDVMRDALADLLQGEAQYAAVVDAEGRIDGVLSVEIISEFLKSPEAKSDEHSAVERPLSAERASEISGDDERERAKRESHDD